MKDPNLTEAYLRSKGIAAEEVAATLEGMFQDLLHFGGKDLTPLLVLTGATVGFAAHAGMIEALQEGLEVLAATHESMEDRLRRIESRPGLPLPSLN